MTKNTQDREKAHDLAKWIISVNGNVSRNEITELADLVVSDLQSPRPRADLKEGWRPVSEAIVENAYIVNCNGAIGEAHLHYKDSGDHEWWWANTDSEYADRIYPTEIWPLPAAPKSDGGA